MENKKPAHVTKHDAQGLHAVVLSMVGGTPCVYVTPISSIECAQSTDRQIPWALRVNCDTPPGVPKTGLRAILHPDGRVLDAGCFLIQWPSLDAWATDKKMAEVRA